MQRQPGSIQRASIRHARKIERVCRCAHHEANPVLPTWAIIPVHLLLYTMPDMSWAAPTMDDFSVQQNLPIWWAKAAFSIAFYSRSPPPQLCCRYRTGGVLPAAPDDQLPLHAATACAFGRARQPCSGRECAVQDVSTFGYNVSDDPIPGIPLPLCFCSRHWRYTVQCVRRQQQGIKTSSSLLSAAVPL